VLPVLVLNLLADSSGRAAHLFIHRPDLDAHTVLQTRTLFSYFHRFIQIIFTFKKI